MFQYFVVSVGMSPTDFWDMTISETMVLHEATRSRQPGDYAGSLTHSDVERLKGLMEE